MVRNLESIYAVLDGELILLPAGMTGIVLRRSPGGVMTVRWDFYFEIDEQGLPVVHDVLVDDDVIEGEDAVETSRRFRREDIKLQADLAREDVDDHCMDDEVDMDDDDEGEVEASAA